MTADVGLRKALLGWVAGCASLITVISFSIGIGVWYQSQQSQDRLNALQKRVEGLENMRSSLEEERHRAVPESTNPSRTQDARNKSSEAGEQATGGTPPKAPDNNGEVINSHRANDFLFDLHGCFAGSGIVECELTITNMGDDRTLSLFGKTKFYTTKLFDNIGGEHYAESAQLGEYVDHIRVNKTLITGIPISASFLFRNVPADAARVAVLEINFALRFYEYSFKFRDVPIER
ncbi:MAG: hypothetical protein AAGC60_23590 [Acidobacteriota bacterium]